MNDDFEKINQILDETEAHEGDEETKRVVSSEVRRTIRRSEPGAEQMLAEFVLESFIQYCQDAKASLQEHQNE